jgi:DNA modification methylase
MKPAYSTALGQAYCGDSLDVMASLSDASVSLIVTSPPFPLTFRKRKPYNTIGEADFVEWFLTYARECRRLLSDTGSFVIDLGGVWNRGSATKSLYQYRLVVALCDEIGFHLAQDFYWYNPAALPAPAEWVNVRRVRVKSAVNLVFWLSKTENAVANNRNVLRAYSPDMRQRLGSGDARSVSSTASAIRSSAGPSRDGTAGTGDWQARTGAPASSFWGVG